MANDLTAIEPESLRWFDGGERGETITVSEPTLESLAKRVEALEIALGIQSPNRPRKDWRKVIGMFHDSDFMRQVDEECLRMREAEREAARREGYPE